MSSSPVQMRRRVIIATALLMAMGLGLIGRLAHLQLVEGEALQQKAVNQQMRDTEIGASRGTIYDSTMKVLAQSATVWNVYISPADIKGTDTKIEQKRQLLANGLGELLGIDAGVIYEKTLKTKSYAEYIVKKVENDVREKILQFKSDNPSVAAVIGLEEDSKRYYPNGELAATVLGFTGTDGQGLAGLEAYYDTTLTGVPGRVMTIKNAQGTEMDFAYEQRIDPKDGNNLVLTLNQVIQSYLEKNLDKALEDYDASRAVGIVLNVNTFEILGMATRSAYDPNDPFAIADEATAAQIQELEGDERTAALAAARSLQWRNTAIADTYEPGSVFKSVTAASALDEGAVTLKTTVECKGRFVVGGWGYKCNNYAVHGTQDVVGALKNSCNIGFIQIGQKLGASAFCAYYKAFGLTEKTGIDLPGEVTPAAGVHYHAENSMGVSELASSSFGQSQKVTPLQMVTAMAAIVNGGKLGTPHLVKQVLDSDGNIVSTADEGFKRQVVSEATSEQMRYALEKVVSEGGGKNASVAGYRIGGKTGTAEKLDNEDRSKRVVSFCGFAPADDPQIACIVVVDEPRAGSYGSTVAAPLFKAIMEDVLPYLGIETTGETVQSTGISVPNVLNQSVADAQKAIADQKLTAKVIGSGDTVLAQFPDPQTLLGSGGVVALFTGEEEKQTVVDVPDFRGMTLVQANQAAAAAGLNLRLSGNATGKGATVSQQSIEPKSQVTPGTIVTLNFIVHNRE